MTLLPLLMIAQTMAIKQWSVDEIPMPLIDPEGCNLDKPGWLCDPDFWYSREECNTISEILGPVDQVPPMALLLLQPDFDKDAFGNLEYASCDLKQSWISSLNDTVPYPYHEMQMNLIKGIHYRVCPAGVEDLTITSRILDSRYEVLKERLQQYLPELTPLIQEVREDLEVQRVWHNVERYLFAIIAAASGLLAIFYQRFTRYLKKGSNVILPWTA